MSPTPVRHSYSYLKATFWERLIALIIDELILLIPILAVQYAITRFHPNLSKINFAIEILITASYNIYLLQRSGATIGKRFMKIKVVSKSYKNTTLRKIVLRETLAKWISNVFLNLGFAWVLIDKNRQAWHDKIADTLVIKVDEKGHPISGSDPPITKRDKAVFAAISLVWGILAVILPIFVFFYLFIGLPHQVKGSAMEPNLRNNEFIITRKIAFQSFSPQRGDIIIFHTPKKPGIDSIKRIISLPGEQIQINGGNIYINGRKLNEPYLSQNTSTKMFPGQFMTEDKTVIVPVDAYFVLGDNRSHSSDSREYGVVPKANIIGIYWFTYWRGK